MSSHGDLLPGGLSEQAQYTINGVSRQQLASVFNELENLVERVLKSAPSMEAWVWEALFSKACLFCLHPSSPLFSSIFFKLKCGTSFINIL